MSMTVKEAIAMAEQIMDMEGGVQEIALFLIRFERMAENNGADRMADAILKAWKETHDELYPAETEAAPSLPTMTIPVGGGVDIVHPDTITALNKTDEVKS